MSRTPPPSTPSPPAGTARLEAVWRAEQTRLVSGLVRLVRDVAMAEDLAQDALVAALDQWPESGIPANPGAWLMTVAKRRAMDAYRRADLQDRKYALAGRELPTGFVPDFDQALDDTIGDDILRLMFICCHPVLKPEARVALTLRLLGGLTTAEIARSFVSSEATVAQRILRAKRTIADAGVAFEDPTAAQRPERLTAVLAVLYLVFNEGYSATAGDDWMRPALCEEALRLGRVLAGVAPDEPEVHGLVALMEIQASRAAARVTADGTPVLLFAQDRARWDQLLIRRGLAALDRADLLLLQADTDAGQYQLQAAIAACHARARFAEATDWLRICALYDQLLMLSKSAVVAVNRAVAVGMAYGPAAGLALIEELAALPQLADYHLLPTVRADLLVKLGRPAEARPHFEHAATLTRNQRERTMLNQRATDCG